MHGKRGAVLVCVDNLPPGVSRKAFKRFVQQMVDQGRSAPLADPGQTLGIAASDCIANTDAIAITCSPTDPTHQPNRFDAPHQATLSVAALARALGAPLSDQNATAPPPYSAAKPCPSNIVHAVPTSQRVAQPPGGQLVSRARRTLRPTPNVADCAILRVTDQWTREVAYRGLVAIRPARCALAVIAVLDGLEVAGFRLRARRFQPHGEVRSISAIVDDEAGDGDSLTRGAEPSPCALELVAATPAALTRGQAPIPAPAQITAPIPGLSGRAPVRSGAPAPLVPAMSTAPTTIAPAVSLAPGLPPDRSATPMPGRPASPTPTAARPPATKPAPPKSGPAKADPLPPDLDTAADGRAFAH